MTAIAYYFLYKNLRTFLMHQEPHDTSSVHWRDRQQRCRRRRQRGRGMSRRARVKDSSRYFLSLATIRTPILAYLVRIDNLC